MKRILLLSLILLPIVALAQYPTFSNKQKLGVQTTGDGLIFRGNLEVPNYQPSNVNNAYFYLDTVRNTLKFYKDGWIQIYPSPQFDTTTLNVYLKISDTTAMLLPYFRDSDTTSLNLINRFALKLNISDTATMLTPYMKKADTISLSNRINLKLNISDTTILSNRITTNANNIITINNKLATKLDTIYTKFKDVVKMIVNKDTINIGSSLTDGYAINIIGDSVNVDTSIIFTQSDTITLSNRINNKLNISDTVSLSNRIDLKLNKTDTINLSNRIDLKLNKSDTISLSNRINTKLNTSDTVSLSNRINKKLDTLYVNYQTSVDTIVNKDTINITTLEAGLGINIANNIISLDTILLDSIVSIKNVYVKNGTGTILNKGEAVYVTGADGTNIIVGRASNIAESSSSKTLGLTMTSIPVNGFGYVIKEGLLAGLNTNSANAGDPVWLSNTPGGLIFGLTNKPYAPNHLVYLGIVTRKQQNNGEIYVTVQNGFEIKELHDVQITDPVNKASLYYNSSENLWKDTTATLLVSDTASMLSKYVNTYSNQTNINGEKSFNNNINIPSYNLGTFTSEKSFNVLFNNDANQKVRLYFPANSRLQGGYEITISSGYYYVQASGMLRKSYGVQLQENGTLYVQSTHVPYVLGAIGNHFTISDFEYDSQTNTWGVIIACLSSNASNYVHINIKSYINPENLNTWLNARASAANITNIYTTNTTVYPNLNPTNLSKSDTASMLLPYVNTYGNQININGNKTFNNIVTIDSLVANRLDVNSPVSSSVKINSNTYSTEIELMNSGGKSYIKSNNKNITLQTDTTALVYLKGDDNRVGILTMSPQQALQVAGNVRIDSLNNNLTPFRLIGSTNNNDLTNVNLGEGLSFLGDTLKVDLTIIDTAIAASSITLTGHVTGTGSTNSTVNTTINNGVVTNDMLAGGISDNKLNTITATGKVDNSATTATSSNNPNTIVLRDASRNFTANNITANNFYGLASTSTIANSIQSNNTTGIIKLTTSSNAVLPILTVPDVNATIATTNLNQTFGGTQTFTNTIIGNISGNAATVTSVTPSNFANQSANTVLAAPNGSSGTPSFRSLVSSDIPSLNYLPLTGGTLSKTTTYPSNDSILTKFFIRSGANNFIPTYGIFAEAEHHLSNSSVGIFGSGKTIYGTAIGIQGLGIQTDMNGFGSAIGVRGDVNATFTNSGGTNGTTYAGYFSNNSIVDGNNYGLFINTSNKGDYGIYQTGTGINYFGSNSTFAGNITANSFIKSGGTSSQFLKADGSVDANTYLTTGTAASTYLPLTGGTLTGTLNGINQNLTTNLSITDPITGNPPRIYTSVTTGPSSTASIRLALDQSTSGGANMFMGGSQLVGGNSTNPNIFFTDSRRAYASIGGVYTGAGITSSGHIVFNTTPNDNTTALTERMRITQDGKIGINTSSPSYNLEVNGSFNTKDFTNHTFVNYIQNGDFDLTSTIDASSFGYGYPHYIPLHWKSAATGKYVSTWSSTGGYSSPGHFKQYDGDASTGGALFQDVTNWQDLKGKTVTACGWFTKGTLTNSGNHAEIQINDGLTTTTTSIGTTTSWQRACVTKTISASATRVRVIVGCNLGVSGEGGAVSDIDAISLVIGEGKHEFSPKPLFDRDTQRLSGTLLIGYDSENNLAYNPSATSNLKVAGSTSLNGTLDVNGTLRVRTTNTVTPSTILGRDVNGVVSGVFVGSGLSLSSGTLSLASSGGFITTNSDYTVTIADSWIVFNNNFSNITVTLPDATTSLGRTLYFRNTAAGSIVSAGTANVINNTITTGTPTNDILGAGNTNVKWCTLVSNGTYWIKMQGGSL